MAMALHDEDFGLWLINFDPEKPAPSLFASATEAMLRTIDVVPAVPVPWPAEWRPVGDPLPTTPTDRDPLPMRDVLIVTWTAGEARTLAKLMADDNFDSWHEYRNNLEYFIPKVTGPRAPFNTNTASMRRYYHTLGLYFPLQIGAVSALAFKSGLHMAYDGPDMPVVDLWRQIIAEVQPKLIITTGTGGGIGADVLLGDVIVAGGTRFRLITKLKDKPFADASYTSSAFDGASIKALGTIELLKPNGDRLETPRTPEIIVPPTATDVIVSTDTFAFDDSTNYFHLQGLGKCCDMGDATLGLAISTLGASAPPWIAIRNASDPQIPNPTGDMQAANHEAGRIYSTYQLVTTAGSVVATWATVVTHFPKRARSVADLALARVSKPSPPPADTAESVLLAMTAATSLTRNLIPTNRVAPAALAALKARLQSENVPYETSTLSAAEVRFTDLIDRDHTVYAIDVANHDAEVFMATYVISRGTIVATFETVSG
jgi:nucleoside phosphorylase